MLTTASIVFAVNVLSSILKRVVAPKWGTFGTQVVVFVLALIGALYFTLQGSFPGIVDWVKQGLQIFALAVTLYEVILSRIPLFKGSSASVVSIS